MRDRQEQKRETTAEAVVSEEKRARNIANLIYVIERNVLAMQAAWIEWQEGRGAEAAMIWIENTLDGPDLLPHDGGIDAQAFFDRESAAIDARLRAFEAGLTPTDAERPSPEVASASLSAENNQ